ncbi:hypothetical protein UFOVP728_36 [uncultured Caudovirales phage]|uniref:Uncharacterized protein n=1 Tax=uncultured Caudovirales phage TaxID=2100421 RepID=A0A6J5NVV3_9CAUD|nr:hypothetical protein UFOVP728_36 [uncultured Caudovirales phage]
MTQWGGPTSLARKLGHTNGSYLAQLAGPHPTKDVSERVAREIESKLGVPEGWMDRAHRGPPGQPDTGLLIDIVATVRDVLDAEGVKAQRAKVEELVALVYEQAAESGSFDQGYLRRLVKLIK